MQPKRSLRWFLLLALLAGFFQPVAAMPAPRPAADVTAYDLIIAMNTLRVSQGLPALIEDPIINAVAQSTAATMAASNMSWHIGDVSGRLQGAGYGGGAKVWGTENFAAGSSLSIDEIMVMWADPSHMIPAVNPAYCNVGAGVATAPNGLVYYVLQAAYTSNKACGEYRAPEGFATLSPDGSTTGGGTGAPGVSQVIIPVKIATPDAEGKVFHVVQAGQSFWAIAVAYQITIKDIETWNNISQSAGLQIGQKLFIPGENTAGYATPTPVGMIVPSTPGPDGKIIHKVASYQTLTTIAAAYHTDVDTLLRLNSWRTDWPLQIGQDLVVHGGNITPSPTPRPLTPIEKLTPAADGKYYHTVASGETLSWIADLYRVNVFDLMGWNGLNSASILQPAQKLLLQVTPPATATALATATLSASLTFTPGPPTVTPSATPSRTLAPTAAEPAPAQGSPAATWFWTITGALVAGGLFLVVFFSRRRG